MVAQPALPISTSKTKNVPHFPRGRWKCEYPGCTKGGIGYANKKTCGPTHRSALWRRQMRRPGTLAQAGPSSVEPYPWTFDRKAVERVLPTMDARERAVFRYRSGLDGPERKTLAAIGRDLGITRQAVMQVESRLLARLRGAKIRRRIKQRT